MKMASTPLKSVAEIFNQTVFRIPDYQRGYAWGKKQREDFWEDLENLKEGQIHYTGVLTIEGVEENIFNKWEDDLWLDIKTTGLEAEGRVGFKNSKKPEALLKRIIEMSTNTGEIVLDSFAGSATTSAVAHKLNRKWITIELGKHAEDLCVPRLKNVINGDDTGISKIVNWKGGGGFKYYKLGESLISGEDINWGLTYEQIAEALFYAKNFKLIENKEFAKRGIFVGENQHEKGVYAICTLSKNIDFIKNKEYHEIVEKMQEAHPFKELNIYTNKAVNVHKEEQEERVFIRKIPQSILKKYGLI
jgi:adenine-specific DNA-methyltransferase